VANELDVYLDPLVLETYETNDHFECYPLERNISLGVHIHIVEALKDMPNFPRRKEMLAKTVNVLKCCLTTEYLVDKWHSSPYYCTSHAIIALSGLADEVIKKQIKWLLKTQREDGSWLFYTDCPQAAIEETAHALLALMIVYERKGDIPFEVIERGYRYLETHYRSVDNLPALWIHKNLYKPYYVVEAIILSALLKYQTLRRKVVVSRSVAKSIGTRPLIYAS